VVKGEQPTRLLLVRHGEVVESAQGKFLGFTDAGLSAHGRNQLERLARHLQAEALDRAYASDLERAVESARIVCREKALEPEARFEFREMNMGDWDGQSWKEIDRRNPDRKKFHFSNLKQFHFPGGENWDQFRNRVLRGLYQILDEGRGKTILLAAHAGVNRVILAKALGLPFKRMFFMDQAYACLNIIDFYSNYAMVKLVNATFYEDRD
jgi:alpha-ribazole phosphatase